MKTNSVLRLGEFLMFCGSKAFTYPPLCWFKLTKLDPSIIYIYMYTYMYMYVCIYINWTVLCWFKGRSFMHEPVCFLWFMIILSECFILTCLLIQRLTTLLHFSWMGCCKMLILFLYNQWKHYFDLHCFIKLLCIYNI